MGIKSKIVNLVDVLVNKRRVKYQRSLKKQNRNFNPTIIANDCMGGMIYHTLGLRFCSPTINLAIPKESFFNLCEDLEHFLQVEVREVKNTDKSFPVGELLFNGRRVEIYFMHYKTFEEAKQKWEERLKRVDFNNLFILQTLSKNPTDEDIYRFEKLPYKNKMLILGHNKWKAKNVVENKAYQVEEPVAGAILQYERGTSKKRYMDYVDYVKFLNPTK